MLFKTARFLCIHSTWILLFIVQSMHAAEPVRAGSGFMTFDTVPDWGLILRGNHRSDRLTETLLTVKDKSTSVQVVESCIFF